MKALSETGFPSTLASCHFVSPGTTTNTSSGLTPGSSAGLGFSTFAALGFDFTAGAAGFCRGASATSGAAAGFDAVPAAGRFAELLLHPARTAIAAALSRIRRGFDRLWFRMRFPREERIRLAQARLLQGHFFTVFVSTRTGPTGNLLVRKPSSEILDDLAEADQPFGAVAVFVAGCQPPRANLLFQHLGHAPLGGEANDLATGPMDVSAASADPVQRLLQEVDRAAVVPPRTDRDV